MYIPVTVLGLYFAQQLGLSLKDLQRAAATEPETVSSSAV